VHKCSLKRSAQRRYVLSVWRSAGWERTARSSMTWLRKFVGPGPAIRREVRAHILAELPKSGGLNEWVAGRRFG
jgi:hypothetical protein